MKMIRNLQMFFRRESEVFKQMVALRSDPARWSMLGIGRKVIGYPVDNVVLSNDVLLMNNILPQYPAAVASPSGFIYVNDAFLKLDGVAQYALIMHEHGHHVLGHVNVSRKKLIKDFVMRNLGIGGVQQTEHDADMFSLAQDGDMIHALKQLKAAWGDVLPLVGQREIDERIKYMGPRGN